MHCFILIQVYYGCMDGSSNNRAFVKIHFHDDEPAACNFTTHNPSNPSEKMVFLMDPSVSTSTCTCISSKGMIG